MKSVVGLTEAGLFEDTATVAALLAGIQEGRILELLQGPAPIEGVEAFIRLLRDLGPLINQEAIDLLVNSPNPVFHATDIIDGLQKGAQFIIDDPRVFLRTSILDFDEVAALFGLYGSYYAGYGPSDAAGYEAWLSACAGPSRGKTWAETAVPLAAGVLSVGGWADPLRVLPLEALGAKATIAVNRLGGVGSFTEDAARLLNATEDDIVSLFSFVDPSASFYQGLAGASGVWCADWDGQMSVPNLLFDDAYTSPLITSYAPFLAPRFGYANVGPGFTIEGCTPGFAPPSGLRRKGRY